MSSASALPWRCWRPAAGAAPAWATLALVHGIGSHAGSFEGLAHELAAQGLLVGAIDLPGHGLAPGRRGDVGNWQELLAAVAELLARCSAAAPGLPLLLLGHSLGGTLVLDYVRRHPGRVQATVVSNPALGIQPSWRLSLAGLLARIWPGFTLPTGFPLAAAASDPAVQERIRRDPLRHDRCSARLAMAWQRVCAELQAGAASGVGPLLVLQSSDDPLISAAAVLRYVAALPAGEVVLKLYGASRHELFDDRERERVIADLVGWLRERVGP